ncbi:hypothetical protein LPJ53_004939 [Coemansia erecta]|uniref:AB hydrolase-1 domain-containing protein n=1 Tax=Coemansia erecta TaxID=147472 RepID=A0A9W8CR34_9FUNG|nr:hypothetical protein LPJ53_004939 [Coemansia erecta]
MAVDRPATSHSTHRGSGRGSGASHDSGSDDDVFDSSARPKSARRTKTSPHHASSGIALVRTLRRTFTSSLHSLVPAKGTEKNAHEKDSKARSESPGAQVSAIPIRISATDAGGESLALAHSANVPSPLQAAFSPESTGSDTAAEGAGSSASASSSSAASSGATATPAPDTLSSGPSSRSVSTQRSFLNVLGLSGLRSGTKAGVKAEAKDSSVSSKEASPGSPGLTFFSRQAAPSPPLASERTQARVHATVAAYMELGDRRTSGFIDSPVTRRPGLLRLGARRTERRQIYHEVYGTGPRKLLLIMGMLGSTMYWRLQTRYFASLGTYTVCVFDNIGSGRSTIAPGPYRVSQMARDAYAVLAQLGWDAGVHVVGISLGGMVAQEMCLQNTSPARFASVVLVDTWHSAALALPTAKEVAFSFRGMSALGSARHLIDLVFSREWAAAPFHDATRDGIDGSGDEEDGGLMTNRDVMKALFQAIQADLDAFRSADAAGSARGTPQSSPGVADPPGLQLAVSESLAPKAVAELAQAEPPTIHPSASATLVPDSTPAAFAAQPAPVPRPPRREVSGDLHQFFASLGHRLSSDRVRQIRTRNPEARFLVVHGEKDRVIRPLCGRALAKLLECPVVWLRSAGHMPPIDAHCTFNLVVRAFTAGERWLDVLPDRAVVVPAPWDEQVEVRRWIADRREEDGGEKEQVGVDQGRGRLSCDMSETDGGRRRRGSKIEHVRPVGPLDRELLLVDEAHGELAGRIIPPNTARAPPALSPDDTPAPSLSPAAASAAAAAPSRELVLYGALVDAPFRIRRYDQAA